SQEFTNDETLILSLDGSNNYAFFINESKFESRINSIDDLLIYLEKKYIRGVYISATSKYFYIERAKEYGPYTLEVLKKKVKIDELNKMCFVRHEGDETYEQGVRIKDLLQG